MNPHRLSWGFAFDFPFAQVTAIVTLLGFLFSRDRRFIWNAVTIIWVLLVAWMSFTTLFALDPVEGAAGWEKMIKVQLFSFLTVALIYTRERILALVWVVAMSLGFFGLKGGLYVIRTGGDNLVWGPPGSFIQGNNELALALIMALPLLWYLYTQYRQQAVRLLLGAIIIMSIAAVLGSHSRGAALAGAAMLGMLWLKSSHKLALGLAGVAVLPVLLLVMPASYFERVQTITTWEEDGSAMGRIRAWRAATDIAMQSPVGVGFNGIIEPAYRQYAPAVAAEIDELGITRFQDAHSIYFKMLGEHGFVGLLLYVTLGFFAYFAASRLAREAEGSADLAWVPPLARMLQVSIIGFAAGGAFLGLAHFDLIYCLVALVLGLQIAVRDAARTAVVAAGPEGGLATPSVRDAAPQPDPDLAPVRGPRSRWL
jgi:probable O-glycosylation ligase (exosortase A-associated)